MSNTPSKAEIEALVKRHGATSYRNRADTQHPAYGFTEDGLNGLIDEVLAKWGTQPQAGAGMGHTDGGRNMFYEGRFDGESQREQQARLRWANDMRAAFERHTGNGWFDKDWRTETGLWSSAWHACLAAQPSPTAQAEEAVALDHIAVIEDGELRYMTGRKAPAYDCELYAMPDGKRAPVLFTAPQPVAREPLTCEWTHNDDDGYWDTSCGKAWRFDDGGPKENNMNFCHCCGKTLRIKGGQHGTE